MTLDELYHKDVLRLAARASGAGRLPMPTASATLNNPICGDQVTVDVLCSGVRLSQVRFEVKACVLCQASASILGEAAQGETARSLAELSQALHAMLEKHGQAPPQGKFSIYAALAPVSAHPSRHSCVLLPLDALLKAMASCTCD